MPQRTKATIETILYDHQFIIENPELELTLEAEALQITVEQMQIESTELAQAGDTIRHERLSRTMSRLSELLYHVREEMSLIGRDVFDTQDEYIGLPDSADERADRLPEQQFTAEGIEFLNQLFGDTSELNISATDIDGIIATIGTIKGTKRALPNATRSKLRTVLLGSDDLQQSGEASLYVDRLLSQGLLRQDSEKERRKILREALHASRTLPADDQPLLHRTLAKDLIQPSTAWVSKSVAEHLRMTSRDRYDDDNPLAWQQDALCAQVDPEAFFPEKGGTTRDAKKICNICEVKAECLEYALTNDERFGIWGGMSERERRKLRRR